MVSQAGGVALVEAVRAAGLDGALSTALAPWRKPMAVHDPAKVLLRSRGRAGRWAGTAWPMSRCCVPSPAVFGLVASDPTVSRTIDALAADAARALTAIDAARAAARARVWALAGEHAPDHGIDADRPLIIDIDATLVTAHSEKEQAAPTFKRGFGFHPLWAFARPRPRRAPVSRWSFLLRAGNAGSNTADDHIAVIKAALAQLPGHRRGIRPGRKVLSAPTAPGTHELLDWLVAQRLSYSVGFDPGTDACVDSSKLSGQAWTRPTTPTAIRRRRVGQPTSTGLLDLPVLAERDAGHRPQGTPAPRRAAAPDRPRRAPGHRVRHQHRPGGQLADLELRHRRRARARTASATPKTPGCATCPCTTSRRTRSGAPSSPSPASSPPGCRCSPSPGTTPAAGNPNDCGCGCSPPPADSPPTAGSSACTCPRTHPGPCCSPSMISILQAIPAG